MNKVFWPLGGLIALLLVSLGGLTTQASEPERPTVLPPSTHAQYFPYIIGSGPTWTPTASATPTATATRTATSTTPPTHTPTPLPNPLILNGYQDTWIWSDSPNQPWASLSSQVIVGEVPQNGRPNERFVGLAQFDLRDLNRAPTSLQIASAILILNVNGSCEDCTPATFTVSEIDRLWLESETTWNNMSSHLGVERTHGGQFDVVRNQIRIDITELVRDWWQNEATHPNYGLAIQSNGPVAHFKSHRFTTGGGPVIEVRFR